LGRKESWAARPEACGGFNPLIERLVLSSQWKPDVNGPVPEYGVAWLRGPASMENLAQREKGALDTIADFPAVLSARNAYFIQFAPQLVGMIRPAERQEASRWARFCRTNQKIVVDPYLRETAASADAKTPVLMALDLTDAVCPDACKAKLSTSPAVAESKANHEALAKVLTGIRGVRFAIKIDDAIRGEMKVDFTGDVAVLAPVARSLWLEVLAARGVFLEDFLKWKVTPGDKSITFSGDLSQADFRQLMTLVQPPQPSLDNPDSGTAAQLSNEINAANAQRYFRTVTMLLDDLKKPNSKVKNYQDSAQFFENYAKKIQQLPTFGVDPDLVAFGAQSAARLHTIAQSLSGEIMHLSTLEQAKMGLVVVSGGGGLFGRNNGGGAGISSNVGDVNIRQAELMNKGRDAREEVWRMIDSDTAMIAEKMSKKYTAGFSTAAP
jgi:hypothetical protein